MGVKAVKAIGDYIRDPQDTFGFSGLLGLAELRKVVILMISVYYNEETIQIEISKGIKCIEQNPGEIRYKLPVALEILE